MRRPIANEPLGLPRGSVRSVLAIVVVMAAVCLAFAGQLESNSGFLAITGSVVAWYFAGRQSTPSPTGISITATKESTNG